MTKTCKNCKNWKPSGDKYVLAFFKATTDEYDDFVTKIYTGRPLEDELAAEKDLHKDYAELEKVEEFISPMGKCDKDKIKYEYPFDEDSLIRSSKGKDNDCLFYWDGEDYMAGHLVGPDFGCVHFEGKV